MNFLVNGYSPNMCFVPNVDIEQRELTLEEFEDESIDAESYIGHDNFATKLTRELKREIPCNRGNLSLRPGDTLYYACIKGRRLKEGNVRIPKNADIRYFRLKVKKAII